MNIKLRLLVLMIVGLTITTNAQENNQRLFNYAVKIESEGKYNDALTIYKNLLKTDSNNVNFLTHTSILYSRLGFRQNSEELKTNLAISLHATNDKLRTDIMAINKRYPLKDLLTACKTYNHTNPNQKITFEYVMLKGINDQSEHALELINLIKKFNLNVKINLIPFNPWNGCEYDRSSIETISKFQQILKDAKLISPIRKTRGDDVLAACGQLKSESQREKKTIRPIDQMA